MECEVPSYKINPQISSHLDDWKEVLQRKKSCQAHEKVCEAAIADLRSLDAKSIALEVLGVLGANKTGPLTTLTRCHVYKVFDDFGRKALRSKSFALITGRTSLHSGIKFAGMRLGRQEQHDCFVTLWRLRSSVFSTPFWLQIVDFLAMSWWGSLQCFAVAKWRTPWLQLAEFRVQLYTEFAKLVRFQRKIALFLNRHV